MKSATEIPTTVAARVAGEDLQPGDFITSFHEVIELPSFLWACSSNILPLDEPVRTRFIPRDAGLPFKVVAVCLPFVYTKRPQGKLITFDTRRQQLVRLDPKTGRKLWKQMLAAEQTKTD